MNNLATRTHQAVLAYIADRTREKRNDVHECFFLITTRAAFLMGEAARSRIQMVQIRRENDLLEDDDREYAAHLARVFRLNAKTYRKFSAEFRELCQSYQALSDECRGFGIRLPRSFLKRKDAPWKKR